MTDSESKAWGRLVCTSSVDWDDVALTKESFSIGRAKTCDYTLLGNKLISGQHCRILHPTESEVVLEDTSTNGMLINKKIKTSKNEKYPLKHGDEFYLVYRKLQERNDEVVSFRLELRNPPQGEENQMEKTISYDDDENTEDYEHGESKAGSVKRKRESREEEVLEAKKIQLTKKEDEDKVETSEVKKTPEDESKQEEEDKAMEEEASQDEMMETLICSICQDILYDCISLQPCMHTFCAACYSGWLKKSKSCPTCRKRVKRISKNHIVNNLTEAYLKVNPSKRRCKEEMEEMDKLNELKKEMVQLSDDEGDDAEFSDEDYGSDDDDDDDINIVHINPMGIHIMPRPPGVFGRIINAATSLFTPFQNLCRQCPGYTPRQQLTISSLVALAGNSSATSAVSDDTDQPGPSGCSSKQNVRTAIGGIKVKLPVAPPHQCAQHSNHLMCSCCQERFPDRRLEIPVNPQVPVLSCSMCLQFYCHLYWGCKKLDCFGCINKLKDLHFGIKCLDTLILGNLPESSHLKKYLQSKNLRWEDVLRSCLEKLESGEFTSILTTTNRITKESVLCYSCGLKVFRELAYEYRKNIPRDELPAEILSRPDCYWGRNCRTQYNKPLHAARFNHICNQTRF